MNNHPDFSVVGTRPPRVDAVDKVTGRATFGTDIQLSGMLYGKVLRSPHAHARIIAVDTREAEALPGVHAVITAEDLRTPEVLAALEDEAQQGTMSFHNTCEHTLAHDKVLYVGHPVAAVAARTPHIAEQALDLIQVEYEVLQPVMDVLAAMQEDAPLLHPTLYTQSLAGKSETPSNVAMYFQHVKGDPDQGFAEAEVVVEREFCSLMVHQGYLEPHVSTAEWNAAGRLTIYADTQGAFAVRDHVVDLLRLPMSQVRVIPLEVGGAFGGKNASYVDVVAALLARKARRPVKVVMTRPETLLATGPASGTVIRLKMGATRAGRITAAQATLYYEAGAYPGSSVGSGANVMLGPYDIPHAQVEGYDVVVNKPPTSFYRAPGATPANFAAEAVVDELAAQLGVDPLDFRLLNSARDGTVQVNGSTHQHIGAVQVLEAAKAHPHYHAPLPSQDLEEGSGGVASSLPLAKELAQAQRRGPGGEVFLFGRGVAHAAWGNWGARSSCTITVNSDGTVSMVTGSVDITGTRTSLAMQAAEILGLDLGQVKPSVGDTDSIGYSDVSAGSRTTVATGQAVVKAARDVVAKMCARAASMWEVPVESVTFGDGTFTAIENADPSTEKRMAFAELAALLPQTGGAIIGVGNVDVQDWGAAFGTHIVDVAVDVETGQVQLLRYTAVQDVGRAINPLQVEGQLQGGATQGIGWALYEGYVYDERGHLLNPTLLDYKLPTALDLPSIETVLVEVPYPNHPFGARGVGEVPIMPPPAAIANAIYDAVGVRMTHLPITPAYILAQMGVIDS
jgi:CO/xanthine dehydrogenase Mo-binding subunit